MSDATSLSRSVVTPVSLMRMGSQHKALHNPPAGMEHHLSIGRICFVGERQRDNVAVVWIEHHLKVLDGEMQEAHHEASDRETMRYHECPLGLLALELAREGLEER